MSKPIYVLTYEVTVYTHDEQLKNADFKHVAFDVSTRQAGWYPKLKAVETTTVEEASKDAKVEYLLDKNNQLGTKTTRYLDLIQIYLDTVK